MTILELKKNLLKIINEKTQILLDRISSLEKEYQTFKTRELKRDLDIENKLIEKIENKTKLLENKINSNIKTYKNSIKKITSDLDIKIKEIDEVFTEKINEIIDKDYDKKIEELKNLLKNIKEEQEKIKEELKELKNIFE